MFVALVQKSKAGGVKLELYNGSLSLSERQEFKDLFTLNFYLQTVASKEGASPLLLILHDVDGNTVRLHLAKDGNSVFLD